MTDARSEEAAHAAAPARKASFIAAGFLLAFAASIFTVIYTGLLVEAPRTEVSAALPTVALQVAQTRTINLAFSTRTPHDDVIIALSLPAGVELEGHAGQRELRWRTRFAQGRNFLPLALRAAAPMRQGQLVARLLHDDQERVFRVNLVASQ